LSEVQFGSERSYLALFGSVCSKTPRPSRRILGKILKDSFIEALLEEVSPNEEHAPLHAGSLHTGQQHNAAWVSMVPTKLHGGLTFALPASMPVAGLHAKAEPMSSEVSQNCQAKCVRGKYSQIEKSKRTR